MSAEQDRISEVLQVFNGSILQSVNQVRKILEQENISWHEFDEWVSNGLDRRKFNRKGIMLLLNRFCPDCGHRLRIDPVNSSACTRIDGGWKSMWYCGKCEWSELSMEEWKVELDKYTDETEAPKPPPKPKKRKGKSKSRIVNPNEHRMLIYRRRRM